MGQGSSSFCEQKEPKKLYYSGAWCEAPALPHHRARIKNAYAGAGVWHCRCHTPAPDSKRIFWFFFAKKNCFFSS
jgi:hypothetical protein